MSHSDFKAWSFLTARTSALRCARQILFMSRSSKPSGSWTVWHSLLWDNICGGCCEQIKQFLLFNIQITQALFLWCFGEGQCVRIWFSATDFHQKVSDTVSWWQKLLPCMFLYRSTSVLWRQRGSEMLFKSSTEEDASKCNSTQKRAVKHTGYARARFVTPWQTGHRHIFTSKNKGHLNVISRERDNHGYTVKHFLWFHSNWLAAINQKLAVILFTVKLLYLFLQ